MPITTHLSGWFGPKEKLPDLILGQGQLGAQRKKIQHLARHTVPTTICCGLCEYKRISPKGRAKALSKIVGFGSTRSSINQMRDLLDFTPLKEAAEAFVKFHGEKICDLRTPNYRGVVKYVYDELDRTNSSAHDMALCPVREGKCHLDDTMYMLTEVEMQYARFIVVVLRSLYDREHWYRNGPTTDPRWMRDGAIVTVDLQVLILFSILLLLQNEKRIELWQELKISKKIDYRANHLERLRQMYGSVIRKGVHDIFIACRDV